MAGALHTIAPDDDLVCVCPVFLSFGTPTGVRRYRVAFLASLIAATAQTASAGNPARRRCLHGCAPEFHACMELARTRTARLRSACTGSGQERKACRHTVRSGSRIAVAGCRQLRRDCRACCHAGGQGPSCPVGQPIDFTPPPPQDLTQLGLPVASSGRPLFLVIPGAQLEADAMHKDALTALGACARWITACVVGTHPLDDCARSAPPCGTKTPWQEPAVCCAPSCFERYQDARRAGAEPSAAFDDVYYGTAPCMPGVSDLLRTGRP